MSRIRYLSLPPIASRRAAPLLSMATGASRALLERNDAAQPKAKKTTDGDVELCAHCDFFNPTQKFGRCRLVKYCSASCQRAHWKAGGHKQICLGPEQRTRAAACRAALLVGPAASRTALANHQSAFNTALANILQTFRGFACVE